MQELHVRGAPPGGGGTREAHHLPIQATRMPLPKSFRAAPAPPPNKPAKPQPDASFDMEELEELDLDLGLDDMAMPGEAFQSAPHIDPEPAATTAAAPAADSHASGPAAPGAATVAVDVQVAAGEGAAFKDAGQEAAAEATEAPAVAEAEEAASSEEIAVGSCVQVLSLQEVAAHVEAAGLKLNPARKKRYGTPQHGLSSKNMALITSDDGVMRSLSIRWPYSPRAQVRAARHDRLDRGRKREGEGEV